jgi:hypothetical protein
MWLNEFQLFLVVVFDKFIVKMDLNIEHDLARLQFRLPYFMDCKSHRNFQPATESIVEQKHVQFI